MMIMILLLYLTTVTLKSGKIQNNNIMKDLIDALKPMLRLKVGASISCAVILCVVISETFPHILYSLVCLQQRIRVYFGRSIVCCRALTHTYSGTSGDSSLDNALSRTPSIDTRISTSTDTMDTVQISVSSSTLNTAQVCSPFLIHSIAIVGLPLQCIYYFLILIHYSVFDPI